MDKYETAAKRDGWSKDHRGVWRRNPEEFWSGTTEPLCYDTAEEVCRLRHLEIEEEPHDLERKVAQQCIADLIAAGYSVTMNDGEEDTVKRSTDADAILAAMFSTDEDYLIAYRADGRRFGWVRFIYGNSGWDVIQDYTTNLEAALTKTMALVEEMSV